MLLLFWLPWPNPLNRCSYNSRCNNVRSIPHSILQATHSQVQAWRYLIYCPCIFMHKHKFHQVTIKYVQRASTKTSWFLIYHKLNCEMQTTLFWTTMAALSQIEHRIPPTVHDRVFTVVTAWETRNLASPFGNPLSCTFTWMLAVIFSPLFSGDTLITIGTSD